MDCENCKCYYSCQYMQHRFGVKECDSNKLILVDIRYIKELRARDEMLKKNGKY